MDATTITGLLNFSNVYMINSISKKIEDYLTKKLLEIKNGGYNYNRTAEWILQVADQNNFYNVVNLSARYIGQKIISRGQIGFSCSYIARTKTYAHYLVKVCKDLEEKTSMLANPWEHRHKDLEYLKTHVEKIEGRAIKDHVSNIIRIANDMSKDNYLYY